jgi:hypothetical protein
MPRTKGAKNKKTLLRERALAMAAAGQSPLEVMYDAMASPNERLRLEAAKAAAPYVHRKADAPPPKPGDDAKLLIGTLATAAVSDAEPTNAEWLSQLRAERATEIATGRSTSFTDGTIAEVERRIAAGMGDKLASFVLGEVPRTPEEEARFLALQARKDEEFLASTKQALEEHHQRQRQAQRQRQSEPQVLLPKRKSEWGNLT